jgi:hypothetical protein
MTAFWGKHPSSRPVNNQTIQYLGDKASYPTTAFGPGVFQVRVASPVAGVVAFDSSTIVTTAATGIVINANEAAFFTVTQGQFMAWSSSTTSTFSLTVTEMA